jgi:sensor domain CHASE-containing protein
MMLRTKVVLILLAFFALFGALDLALQRIVILPSFVELETDEARKDLDRALRSVSAELSHLTMVVVNDAQWDDAYEFVVDANERHIEENLGGNDVFVTYKINLIHYYDTDGKLVWGAEGDIETGERLEIPGLTGRDLGPDHVLLRRSGPTTGTAGIYMSKMGPLLVSAQPILTSEIEGPERGTLVMGKRLDDAAIEAFGTTSQVDLRMTVIEKGGETAEQEELLSRIDPEAPYPIEHSDEITDVYSVMEDLGGEYHFLFSVSVPRGISERGNRAVALASLSLACAGPLLLVVLLAVLQRTVFAPTTQLTRHAVAIAETDDLETRLDMNRKDEIGLLAREFDRMVERLADARRKFIEQSYRAGVAEMASGVLHNVRNAITPAAVQMQALDSVLDGLPLEHLGMALDELASQEAPEERRAELTEFGRLAAEEIGKGLDTARAELEVLEGQLVHIQAILQDQEQFSRADRVFERIQLKSLIAEGLAALTASRVESVEIDIDESVEAAGTLEVARAAAVQIVSNIVLNGIEAIARTERPDGRIGISAVRESKDQMEMVHLRFEDNGIGISPDELGKIYEKGYSSKPTQGTGLGLHSSSNTVRAVGGSIHAESGGVGEGATFHLVLPARALSRRIDSQEEVA